MHKIVNATTMETKPVFQYVAVPKLNVCVTVVGTSIFVTDFYKLRVNASRAAPRASRSLSIEV